MARTKHCARKHKKTQDPNAPPRDHKKKKRRNQTNNHLSADSKTSITSTAIDSALKNVKNLDKTVDDALDVFIVQEKSVPFEAYQKDVAMVEDVITAEGKVEEEGAGSGEDEDSEEEHDDGDDDDDDDDDRHVKLEDDDDNDNHEKEIGHDDKNENPTKKQKLH